MNTETGEVADNSVNVYDAKTIGNIIIKKMVGQSVFRYLYKRKDMVVNMSTKTIECEGEQISIDNQFLFQRLLATAGRDQVQLESGLCFELNSQPTSLFNKEGLLNTTHKPALPEALWEMTEKPIPTLPTSNVLYLLDGGDLLSKLQWKKGQMVQQICWHNFENENYGENAEVAFDGYPDEPTTKDITHLKYTKGKNRRLVKFALNSIMSMSKEKFIFNKINEQEFLQHLTEYMNYHGIKVCVPYFLDT